MKSQSVHKQDVGPVVGVASCDSSSTILAATLALNNDKEANPKSVSSTNNKTNNNIIDSNSDSLVQATTAMLYNQISTAATTTKVSLLPALEEILVPSNDCADILIDIWNPENNNYVFDYDDEGSDTSDTLVNI